MAFLKNEPQYVSYTLLRVDDSIGGGEVFSQAPYEVKPDEAVQHWSFVGHKAIIDNVSHIESALPRLVTNGGFLPLDVTALEPGLHSTGSGDAE